MKNLKRISLIGCAMALAFAAQAQRAPTVTYSVSGSAGNWSLNFDVMNNFNSGEGDIYFFGVVLDSGRNIGGDPSNGYWNSNAWTTWNNSGYGGSSTVYNNNWIDFSYPTGTINPGTDMNGFVAVSTDAVAPTSVQFFAFMTDGNYTGTGNFNTSDNPGFEGVAVQGVPEPASMAVLGLSAVGLVRRRFKK